MRTMMITLMAMEDQEPVAECSAKIDLTTYEITDISDESFIRAAEDTYEGFSIELVDDILPVAVDYLPSGNEFMLMDAEGIDAINDYADDNPNSVRGEDDIAILDNEDDD